MKYIRIEIINGIIVVITSDKPIKKFKEISTGLALAIQNIVDMTPEAVEAFKKYGVDISGVRKGDK
jgi:hypothetical protein